MELRELYDTLVEGKQGVLSFENLPTPHMNIDIDTGIVYLMQGPTKITVGYVGEKSGLASLMNEGINPETHVIGEVPAQVVVGLLGILGHVEEESINEYFTIPRDSVPVLTLLVDAMCVYAQQKYVERVHPNPAP
ncbi:TPA: hypothetical protein HA241_01840 [Candidatus Woesearchaeota archaeon]|nr:hypothetical protein [Candidatus Woesearchaeota archaeon]